jgi:hypothetical protein
MYLPPSTKRLYSPVVFDCHINNLDDAPHSNQTGALFPEFKQSKPRRQLQKPYIMGRYDYL